MKPNDELTNGVVEWTQTTVAISDSRSPLTRSIVVRQHGDAAPVVVSVTLRPREGVNPAAANAALMIAAGFASGSAGVPGELSAALGAELAPAPAAAPARKSGKVSVRRSPAVKRGVASELRELRELRMAWRRRPYVEERGSRYGPMGLEGFLAELDRHNGSAAAMARAIDRNQKTVTNWLVRARKDGHAPPSPRSKRGRNDGG